MWTNWDLFYPVRTLVADIRNHAANYRRFRRVTKAWPVISIATYIGRFFLIIGGIILGIGYEVRHDFTKGQSSLFCLVVIVPAVLVWFIVETAAWNHDLRQKGIGSRSDIWKVSQFPQD
jgi:hypothetical protein